MTQKVQKSEAFVALEKIKEAEEKARKIVHETREKTALEIIQTAYDEAKKIKKNSLEEARMKAEKKKELFNREGQRRSRKD